MTTSTARGRDEPQTAAALEARRSTTQAAHQRVHHVLAQMRRDKAPVTVAAIARRAAVSRTFLYTNPQARAAVAGAAAASGLQRTTDQAAQDTEQEATWRERALNAEDALKTAHAEILQQRTRLGELLGQVRDLQAEWTEGSIQRITTENTSLKQRVRQLTTDNRTLDERLKAARSNMRFQDRRVADLEAQLADPSTAT
jgi:chromosome segregation ATPase